MADLLFFHVNADCVDSRRSALKEIHAQGPFVYLDSFPPSPHQLPCIRGPYLLLLHREKKDQEIVLPLLLGVGMVGWREKGKSSSKPRSHERWKDNLLKED